jgi:lipopolysaccharide export system protein LptA
MTLAVALALAAHAAAPRPAAVKANAAAPARRAVSAASPSSGAAPAGEGRVRVDADEVHYAFQKREVTFTGNPVVLTRADARLTCARLVAKNDARGEIAQAVCTGDVRFVRGERLVTCEKATYEAAAARLLCEGEPVLKDGPSEARGTRLVYDLRADEARLEGAKIVLPGHEVEARQRALEERRRGERQ